MPYTNRYTDPLWGEIDIGSGVLHELAESRPVQRLRGIHMAGASHYLLPDMFKASRFEHSLGVQHVLAWSGARLEEQIAGLLHDVPHTAFSHTVDIVFPNEEHNFHERFQQDVILSSEIPGILQRYNIDLNAALQPDRYPLLEQALPNLCADRIDYSLRDLVASGEIPNSDANNFMEHLQPGPSGPIVDDTDTALQFAIWFRKASDTFWSGPLQAGAYWALAGAIKRAYSLGAFTNAHLFGTDDEAMACLRSVDDERVQAYLHLLTPGTEFYAVERGPHFTTHMKQRYVDPLVLESGWSAPRKLSEISDAYRTMMAGFPSGTNIHYKLWSPSMPAVLAEQLETAQTI